MCALLQRRFSLRGYARWAAGPLALYGLYFGWRWLYFGLPFPTTYYAKSVAATTDEFRGANYVWDALRDTGALWLVPLILWGLSRKPGRYNVFAASLVLLQAAYVQHVGGDWMPFNRFLLPVAPLVAVLFAWGCGQAWADLRRCHAGDRALFAALAAAVVLMTARYLSADSIETSREESKLAYAARLKESTLLIR